MMIERAMKKHENNNICVHIFTHIISAANEYKMIITKEEQCNYY